MITIESCRSEYNVDTGQKNNMVRNVFNVFNVYTRTLNI